MALPSGVQYIRQLEVLVKMKMKILATEILCSQNPNTDILACEIFQQSASLVSVSPDEIFAVNMITSYNLAQIWEHLKDVPV